MQGLSADAGLVVRRAIIRDRYHGPEAQRLMMPVLVCAVLAWTSLRLPETLPKTRRQTLHPRALWVNHSQVRRTYDFLLLSAIPTRNFAAIFIYVAAVPTYPLDLLGVSTYGSAWLFIPRITRIMTGVVLSGHLLVVYHRN